MVPLLAPEADVPPDVLLCALRWTQEITCWPLDVLLAEVPPAEVPPAEVPPAEVPVPVLPDWAGLLAAPVLPEGGGVPVAGICWASATQPSESVVVMVRTERDVRIFMVLLLWSQTKPEHSHAPRRKSRNCREGHQRYRPLSIPNGLCLDIGELNKYSAELLYLLRL
ncbi:hypothetical protein [Deinococcus sp.]|uniref:hypothetical protein n=1 Tax=Deinococcus sp. TaxID=47478 RepID=UPI003C7E9ACB